MKVYVTNIEKDTIDNVDYRKVVYTAKNSQLVLMSLKPGEEIGEEVHGVDQFFRIEAGEGKAILNDTEYTLHDGSAIIVPAGMKHNVVNTSSSENLKLYTLYSPPEHKDGVIVATKVEEVEEHFDGKTTE